LPAAETSTPVAHRQAQAPTPGEWIAPARAQPTFSPGWRRFPWPALWAPILLIAVTSGLAALRRRRR
jgi:hypothetical protein